VGILLTSLACSAQRCSSLSRRILPWAATIVVAADRLICEFSDSVRVCPGSRACVAKLQEHHRPRHAGRSANGSRGAIASTWAPFLRCRGPAPVSSCARPCWPKSRRRLPRGLRLSDCCPRSFTPDETLCTVSIILPRGRGEDQVFRGSSYAGAAGSQAGRHLGLRLPAARSGPESRTRRLRSFVPIRFRFLRFLVTLLAQPSSFVELCARRRHFCESQPTVRRRTAGSLGMLSRRRRASARGTGVDRDETHEFSILRQARHKPMRSDGAHHRMIAGDRG